MKTKLLFILILVFSRTIIPQVPQTLAYQGYLTNPSGNPVDGSHTITFRLFENASGGTSIWSEEKSINVNRGFFATMLGDNTPFYLPFNKQYYLAIKIGADPEMTPRVPLSSAAYAINSSNGIPPGTIVAFGGDIDRIPFGWLLCDGSSISANDKQYTNLYNAIGTSWGGNSLSFNLPDLRGLFLRGVDNGKGNDPDIALRTAMTTGGNSGNKVGSFQPDELGSHYHLFTMRQDPGANNEAAGGTNGVRNHAAATDPAGGNETRPKNAYVNYIIKY